MKLLKTISQIVVLAVALVVLFPTQGSARDMVLSSCTIEHNIDNEEKRADETCLTSTLGEQTSMAESSTTTHSITPTVRTLYRGTHNMERSANNTKAVTAIDATTLGYRYGLYNHKILFYSLARHYYLNRLVRLII